MSIKRPLLAASAIIATLVAPAASARPLFETQAVTVHPEDARGEAAIERTLRDEGLGELATGGLEEVARHVSPTTGRTYLTYEQRFGGMTVYGSTVRATIEEDGTLSQVIYRLADPDDLRAVLTGRPSADLAALSGVAGTSVGLPPPEVASLDAASVTFDGGALYDRDPVASRVLLAEEDGSLAHGFLVESWSKAENELVYTVVDAGGAPVFSENRTANERYVAFKTSPSHGNPTVFGGWLSDDVASPSGWLRSGVTQRDTHIHGANAEAYVDRDGNNAADGGGRVVRGGSFQTMPRLGQDAASWTNQRAAVQSAFYHVNDIHDRLYAAGFTETAGNFQRSNYGRGGRAGDYVRVEVLDGSGTNNANFSTPMRRDMVSEYTGLPPRMQLYEFTRSTPHRPSSFDADIMWHEYGHGVIWRMVGDLRKPIAWAVNEGFADALAVVATNDSRIGEWVNNRKSGIRSADYRGYGRTISQYRAGFASRYANAEIYAATMWRLKELLNANGTRDEQVLDLMIDGLANTKPAPSFIDMRDGLLQAGRGAQDCAVWRAFAQFGMGQGASMSWTGSADHRQKQSVNVRASTRTPSACTSAKKAPAPRPVPLKAPSGGDYRGAINGFSGSALRTKDDWRASVWFNLKQNGATRSGRRVTVSWGGLGETSCVTNANGWCTAHKPGIPRGATSATARITKVDGRRFVGTTGAATSLAVRSPYAGGAAPAPTGSGTFSADAANIEGAGYREGRTWTATMWFYLGRNRVPVTNADVVVDFGPHGRSSCRTRSTGWCQLAHKGLSMGTAKVRGEIVSVNGRTFRNTSGGGSAAVIRRP